MGNNKTAAALGLFDGVHLGHRAVLRTAAEQEKNGLIPCAFTFPPESAANKGAAGYIYSENEKNFILEHDCGIKRVFSPRFADICGMDGETFAKEILCGEMNAAFVCCGNDFRFGKAASCGVEELRRFGEKLGCGGIMTSLVRTSSGGFTLADCYTFEEIQQARDEDRLEELVLPIERVFEKLPKLRLGEAQTRMYRNGVKLDLTKLRDIRSGEDNYGVFGSDGVFIGTAFADRENGILRVGKNLG